MVAVNPLHRKPHSRRNTTEDEQSASKRRVTQSGATARCQPLTEPECRKGHILPPIASRKCWAPIPHRAAPAHNLVESEILFQDSRNRRRFSSVVPRSYGVPHPIKELRARPGLGQRNRPR